MAQPKPRTSITVAEAFATLHRINHATTWRGLNAIQVDHLASMSATDWRRAGVVFHLRHSVRRVVLVLIAIVGFALVYVAWPIGWPELALLALVGVFAYRDGRDSGSADGYQLGHRAGVYKALDLTDDEAANMADWSIRMEVEGRTAAALERKQPPAARP